MDEKTIARFWKKVDRGGPAPAHCPELGPCWPWIAGKNACGYGTFGTTGKQTTLAHRFAWLLANGETSEQVLHKCDNPACVRASHLFLGSQADNVADMMQKRRDRHPRGNSHGLAKLTENAVREIRALSEHGASNAELAARYGVSSTNIRHVVRRRHWKHVA